MKKGKRAILAVSFGTSYRDAGEASIGAIEGAVAAAFPQYEVRRAFTSQRIIHKLKKQNGICIDYVGEGLERAAADGIAELIVLPTHIMAGLEYRNVAKLAEQYRNRFERLALAAPLLTDDEDYEAVMGAVTEETACWRDGRTAVCLMGHGTEAASNAVYERLQGKLWEAGYEDYYIGTVESGPSLSGMIEGIKNRRRYERVVLLPLLVAAGNHASRDMAGDQEGSWKQVLESAGFSVTCVMQGLGQLPKIQEIYVNHAKAAADREIPRSGCKDCFKPLLK